MAYTFIADLAEELVIPQDGTLSKVLYRDDQLRLVGFAFDTGQELTEHTAAVPALIQVVSGRLSVTLEADAMELGPDGWLRMEAHAPHSVRALVPTIMVLTMLRSG
jgi:quercetin dioxygenase-like cupin family protein